MTHHAHQQPTVSDVVSFLGGTSVFDGHENAGQRSVTRADSFDAAGSGSVTFLSKRAHAMNALENCAAALLIVDRRVFEHVKPENCGFNAGVLYLSENARFDFARAVSHFFVQKRQPGVHPSAVVDAGAVISPTASIGPLCFVGSGVTVGDGSEVHGGACLNDGVKIGRNVMIHSGAVIGADGFGYERNAAGDIQKFPHLGDVVIEDDVEIGANTCIDRGSLGSTHIGQGTKIDKLVHIAHNVRIGRNCLVVAGTAIGGSVRIGDRVWVGTGATLSNKLVIGDDAFVSIGTVAIKDIQPGQRVLGRSAGFFELPRPDAGA